MADKRNTFIIVPRDVTNALELHRFLSRLVEKIDQAFGTRADNPFVTTEELQTTTTSLTSVLGQTIEANSTSLNTSLSSLDTRVANLEDNLNNPTISSLSLPLITVSATYTQTEVQELSNQIQDLQTTVNSIVNSLKLSKIIK